jgi:hypothetical protein
MWCDSVILSRQLDWCDQKVQIRKKILRADIIKILNKKVLKIKKVGLASENIWKLFN